MSTLISVIIPVYRDWERLGLCLEALERQTLPASAFEIIVANNEPDPDPPTVRLPANARLIHEPRTGSYAARNSAVAVSNGELLAFVDSDCIPRPDWLERGLRVLEEHPDGRVSGPVPIHREPGSGYCAYLYDFHTAFKFKEAATRGRSGAGNLMVSRAVFDKVGPFEEKLLSAGDADWSERAQGAGVPLYFEKSMIVSHPARRTVAEVIRKRRRRAGAAAQRKAYPAYRYFLYRLLPPFRHFWRSVIGFKRGPLRPLDWIILFFVHWRGQIAEGVEFLAVRKGWKSPTRS